MKYDLYKKMIESTHEDHKKGNLNEIEYINAYNEILDVIYDSTDLTDDEKNLLIKEVRTRIGQIPIVEAERKTTLEQKQQEINLAFVAAKARFKKLSVFQKIKLNISGLAPSQLPKGNLSVEEINGLYKK